MDRLEKALEKARQQRGASGLNASGDINSTLSPTAAATATAIPQEKPLELPVGSEDQFIKHRILAHHTRSIEADIFRILRTQVLHIMNKSGYRTLAIMSPNYGDGKTTIALNLAVSIALDLKQTALLVDLDLRKPNLHEFAGVPSSPGLSDYLMDNKPLSECLVRLSFDRLTILPAGRALDNSSEVLGSPKMAALANELKSRYRDRIIIYDMPPVLAQDDPIAFLPHVDAVLIVVHDGITEAKEIKQTLEILSRANVIGTVLNDSREKLEVRDNRKRGLFVKKLVTMSDQLLDKFEADFEAKGKPALQKLGAQANDLATRAYNEGREKGVPAVKGLIARLIDRLRKK